MKLEVKLDAEVYVLDWAIAASLQKGSSGRLAPTSDTSLDIVAFRARKLVRHGHRRVGVVASKQLV